MRVSRLYLFLIALFFCNYAYSENIVVTSVADDDSEGTLRRALKRAAENGTDEVDIISFNLPRTNDLNSITIRLRSQLPVVTSKVIIDGTTQSGAALGISGAKVILEPETGFSNFSCLVIGGYNNEYIPTANVEIYGLYIRKFANITSLQNVNPSQGSGIILDYRVQNIIIGKPNKGNVICGNLNGIMMRNYYYTNLSATNPISIQSNLIGIMDDGFTEMINVTGISVDLYENTLNIGGDTPAEGNIIAANATDILITRNYSSSLSVPVNIINNKIGTDYTGKKSYKDLAIFKGSSAIEMNGIKISAPNTNVNIHKNIISGHLKWGIIIANSDFLITGNHIGTGIDGTENDLGNGGGIRIEANTQGTIGGTAAQDPNLIGYNEFGVESVSSRPVKITRNSMFCNSKFGIGKAQNSPQAFVQVLKIRSNYISGKASPNSEVELFYTDNCPGLCQGKIYIETVRAGNEGRWEYSGALSGNVTATASVGSETTSQFSTAALLPDEAIVDPVTCKGLGSITISEPREGLIFKWYRLEADGSAGYIKTAQSITDLSVGTYELTIDDGCQIVTHQFPITDQILTVPAITAPAPACGQTSFTFKASTLRGKGNLRYSWIKGGSNVGSGAQINLPEGTYTVKVTDDAGCTQESAPVTIKMRPAPVINNNNLQVTAAACGIENGSIKGIVITTPTGNVSYKWHVYNTINQTEGAEAGQSLDLENVAGGWYRLTVTDESDCSPVYQIYSISIYNSVIISGGNITRSTCNTNNGAIGNVSITEANTYEWTTSGGQSLEKGPYSQGMVLQLKDVAPGTYVLTAKNTITGCSNSRSFQIDQLLPVQYTLTPDITPATCGFINGSIVLNYSSVMPVNFEWKDASGNVIPGTAREIKDLAPGNYRMFAYDVNNCETIFGPYTIENTPLLSIVPATATVTDDGCGLQRASIKGIKVIGGIPGYDFKWINAANEPIQYTQDLINVAAGSYRLIVTDKTTCGTFTSEAYTVNDYPIELQTPVAVDLRVCYAMEIMLPIVQPEEGTYQLFENIDDANPLIESDNGFFVFKVTKTADYHIRRKLGSCISEFVKVHIEVTNDNLEITNTMTPNGDGKNDLWIVKGLPDFGDINIKLYSRSGQLVYESMGQYNNPFDGRFRGKELPAGVYYYKIDLRADCKPLAGSLTLLR